MNRDELENLAEHLIRLIRRTPGEPINIKVLTTALGTDDEAIGTAARLAISWGYVIDERADRALTFREAPDTLNDIEITNGLATEWLGKKVHSFRQVGSTNTIASQLAESGAGEGEIVTADEQKKGRGRFSRNWHSGPSVGIYVSIILRPFLRPDEAPGLSLMTAVALAQAVEAYCPGLVQIKWPNDVLLKGRKVAGILTELSADDDRVNHVIVGVGINVNHQAVDFPDELRYTATSLCRVLHKQVSRVEFLQLFLVKLERLYVSYLNNRLSLVVPEMRRLSALAGKRITVRSGRSRLTGVAGDIDNDGRLMFKTEQGIVRLSAGEVTIEK